MSNKGAAPTSLPQALKYRGLPGRDDGSLSEDIAAALSAGRATSPAWEIARKASFALGVAHADRVKASRAARLARKEAKHDLLNGDAVQQAEAAEQQAWDLVKQAAERVRITRESAMALQEISDKLLVKATSA